MNKTTLHQRSFLLHVQERSGYDQTVLLKEPASEQPTRSHLDQLHNEYTVTKHLKDVAGVRPAYGMEGAESQPVLLLEYIQGQSLTELIRSTSLDMAEKLRLAVNVAIVLNLIHDQQVMHKGMSSSNILVTSNDKLGSQDGVYIIDFGLASIVQQENPSCLALDDALVGALAYISPEQTGRMNRQVDYRTDLYSLGVILYELFTGQLPFESGDPLEMIHAHIARPPRPPHQIDSGIPGPVSDIILKLLTKNAEDRYQTANGLRIDLKCCLDQWQNNNRIEPFALRSDDFAGHLQIPQKLYGRQTEIEQLQAVLDRAVTGSAQLLLVAGYSGVGKTSLVHEIQRDVIAKQAIFIEGKFDQIQRALPYSAWEQAFTQLVNNWLAGSETSLAGWRKTILDAVGDNGQILIDIIPALKRVIGPQPEVPQLRGIENQNRFNYYFNRFISNLATPENSLVVFLDDLQWIDLASLNLIETLFTAQSTNSLLVIGAYRNNEVGADHPLVASQDRMRAESDQVTVITLGDLALDDTNQLLVDSLQLNAADCRDLNRVLVDKTAGNPFYFRQLLYTLESEKLLSFDRQQRRWVWEEELQQSLQTGDNVAELMIRRIRTLPVETQRSLSMAACLGNRFEPSTLAIIIGQEQTDLLTVLSPALQDGLIIGSKGYFSFVHDRIQEAGYALIPESDRPKTHLEIGRLLLAGTPAEKLEEEIFAIVGHLNAGRALIDTDREKINLAVLNLKAGQKAKAASAFVDAKKYIEIGLSLLEPDRWQGQYELTLSLHNENGELASITGQYDQVAPIADLIHANAESIHDQIRIYMVQIEAATTLYDFNAAVEIGLDVLGKLGFEIVLNPGSEDYQYLLKRVSDLLTDRPMEVIAGLSEMTDERALAASTIMTAMMVPIYIIKPQLFPVVGFTGAILTLEFGYFTWSPHFFSQMGVCSWLALDLDTPSDHVLDSLLWIRQTQEAVLEMLENPAFTPCLARGYLGIYMTGAYHWPIEKSIEFAQKAFQSGFAIGDLLFGSQGSLSFAILSLAAGMNLDEYQGLSINYIQVLNRFNQSTIATYLSIYLQGAINFKEPLAEPHRLVGSYFDEEAFLSAANATNDVTGRHLFYAVKLMLGYHFDVDNELPETIREAEKFTAGGPGLISLAINQFYSALGWLRLYSALSPENQKKALNQVDHSLQLMEIWSQSAPTTFQHMYDLIRAEKARVSGDIDRALVHYERAIQDAQEVGFTHNEALANELYARFWAERDNNRFASQFMREAYSLYRKWGALAKANHLAKRYPNWLIGRSIVVDQPGTQIISDELTGDLDLRTVLKASQDIAGEIELDSLLVKLMSNVIENSGAQQGYLILEQNGQWKIVAEAAVGDTETYVREAKNIAETDLLAQGIVYYVARTQETVVLEDASQSGEFAQDPYVQNHQAKSILCTPLINQGKTSGILYLENNLASRVFSAQRINLLKLLSSQMAISIDNARIHDHLEAVVAERTEELQAANEAKSIFLASMSHELRTPLNAILGFTRLMSRDPDATAQQQEELKIINRSGEHLLDMVSDILSLSRIEAERVELQEEPFDLRQMLEDIGRIFQSQAEGKGLRLSLELADDLSPYLLGDAGKLRQVMINLMDNAVKFSETGEVWLRARTQAMEEDPDRVMLRLEVEDSGPGIQPDNLDEIFETFVRFDQTSHTQRGTGLGLSISKSLVELMGGEIGVASEVGQGSLFKVTIPMALTEVKAVTVDETVVPEVIGLGAGQKDWRILVVDDNQENLLLLTTLLSRSGFTLQGAENGEEAVTKFQEWRPHFIWMDVRMPVMDGYEATRKIRALPGGEEVKIVAVTASVLDEPREFILAAGCDDVVRKPFRDQEIFEAMARELGVEYVYRDRSEATTQPEGSELSAKMLAELPPELLQELQETTLALDREATLAVIGRIEKHDPETAAGLSTLVHSFQMGRIRELLKETETINGS